MLWHSTQLTKLAFDDSLFFLFGSMYQQFSYSSLLASVFACSSMQSCHTMQPNSHHQPLWSGNKQLRPIAASTRWDTGRAQSYCWLWSLRTVASLYTSVKLRNENCSAQFRPSCLRKENVIINFFLVLGKKIQNCYVAFLFIGVIFFSLTFCIKHFLFGYYFVIIL